MTETNHASEAAASSPDHRLQASALPDERGLQDIARNLLGYYSAQMQAMAVEILRMRRDCPPTAEIEKLRAGASEANMLHLRMSNIGDALREAGHPPTRTRGDELERIRDLAASRKAWKREADTLGGDLNRIRSLVPTASDEQTTFDAVQGELQRLRSELTQLRAEAKRVDDRVQRLAKVVQCQVGDDVYDAAEKKLGELRAQIATGEVAGEVNGIFPVDRHGRAHVGPGRVPEPSIASTSPYSKQAQPFGDAPCNFGGTKVAPATGQPRTEAPLAADGSGTVLELGEAFREAMRVASRDSLNTEQHRLHHLHTAVAELAKVVERIGAR